MKILVINAGSSSIKYQLMNMDNESIIAKGIAKELAKCFYTDSSGQEINSQRRLYNAYSH